MMCLFFVTSCWCKMTLKFASRSSKIYIIWFLFFFYLSFYFLLDSTGQYPDESSYISFRVNRQFIPFIWSSEALSLSIDAKSDVCATVLCVNCSPSKLRRKLNVSKTVLESSLCPWLGLMLGSNFVDCILLMFPKLLAMLTQNNKKQKQSR